MQLPNEQANREEKKRPQSHNTRALFPPTSPSSTNQCSQRETPGAPRGIARHPHTHTHTHTRPLSRLALLTLKLLDTLVVLAGHKGEGHDAGDVHLRAEDVHVEAELDADGLDVFEALLVVGAGAAHPDLHLVLVEQRRDLAQGADDALEGGGDLV